MVKKILKRSCRCVGRFHLKVTTLLREYGFRYYQVSPMNLMNRDALFTFYHIPRQGIMTCYNL
jgi:hypothetical protein